MGNQDTGKNEIAEQVGRGGFASPDHAPHPPPPLQVLVQRLIETSKERGLKTVSVESRVAPSGSTYIAPFYLDLGFTEEAEGSRVYKLDVANGKKKAAASGGMSAADVNDFIAKVKAEVDAIAAARGTSSGGGGGGGLSKAAVDEYIAKVRSEVDAVAAARVVPVGLTAAEVNAYIAKVRGSPGLHTPPHAPTPFPRTPSTQGEGRRRQGRRGPAGSARARGRSRPGSG